MNIQPMETMLNLTRFERIKIMYKYTLHNYSNKTTCCLVTKFKTKINNFLLNIYEHYYSAACNNVTENDKMNETKNNER